MSHSPTPAPQQQQNGESDAVSRTTTPAQDAIRQGKQKAKETMAAAGVSAPAETMANGGAQLSRKRSRDGTQIPFSRNNSSSDVNESHNDVLLDRYMQRDLLHGATLNTQVERTRVLIRQKEREKHWIENDLRQMRSKNPAAVFGPGFQGYGNRTTDHQSSIVYADQRVAKGRRARDVRMSRKENAQQAEQHEELVPIRLDIELDKMRLRDTFTWNLHEKLIPQDLFADYLLEDLKIPPENYREVVQQVRQEMKDQIHNFYPHIIVEDGPLEPGKPYSEYKDDEMRILVKLNITIGRITLMDQFEWDINNPLNSPEEFARNMAWENALSGEFTTAIAHAIREQSQLYTKSLYLTNHCFDGRPVEDPDIREAFLPAPIFSAFRPLQMQKDWTPLLFEMSEAEFDRTETSMMREHRAQKRQLNRRGGPALPDLKERQRTVRSLIVNSVIPGAVETFETTGILKTRRSGRGGRRGGTRGVDGDVDSDDLESDESAAEDSPAPQSSSMLMNAGTARTRNMRGAASAAQAAMRASNYGARSVTPDLQPTPEARTSARRSVLRDESVPDDDTLIVKLKIGKNRFRQFWDDYQKKKRASEFPLSGYAALPPAATTATPTRATFNTPSRAASQQHTTPQPHQRAPSTPAPKTRSPQKQTQSHAQSQNPITYDSQGRATRDHWPYPDEAPPPPPPWLRAGISALRAEYPDSSFTPIMRPYPINTATNEPERISLEAGERAPEGVEVKFLPRIRCNDCPGKLYTAVEGRVVEDFAVHLRNRLHRERVAERQAAQA